MLYICASFTHGRRTRTGFYHKLKQVARNAARARELVDAAEGKGAVMLRAARAHLVDNKRLEVKTLFFFMFSWTKPPIMCVNRRLATSRLLGALPPNRKAAPSDKRSQHFHGVRAKSSGSGSKLIAFEVSFRTDTERTEDILDPSVLCLRSHFVPTMNAPKTWGLPEKHSSNF